MFERLPNVSGSVRRRGAFIHVFLLPQDGDQCILREPTDRLFAALSNIITQTLASTLQETTGGNANAHRCINDGSRPSPRQRTGMENTRIDSH